MMRIEITVSSLESGQPFAVRATTLDQRSREWIAEARFVASSDDRGPGGFPAPHPGLPRRSTAARGDSITMEVDR